MKILWLDLETTGLSSYSCKITEIAALYIDTDKPEEIEEFHRYIKYAEYPDDYQKVAQITGLTPEVLEEKGFIESTVFNEFFDFINKKIDKFNKSDKCIVAGYNVKFDVDFFRSFFYNNGNTYFGSYFFSASIDVMTIVAMSLIDGQIESNLPNFKLKTVANSVGIEFEAHSAIDDIKATKELFEKLLGGEK